MEHKTASTASELVTILEVTRHISYELPQTCRTILCDSKPALSTSVYSEEELILCSNPINVAELYTVFERTPYRAYQWVPGHCRIHGDDLDDATAKIFLIDGILLTVPFSRPDAILTEAMRKATARHWAQKENCHKRLYRLDPHRTFRMPCDIQRSDASLLS